MHASTTAFGVARVFLLKTARITMASESARYAILQLASAFAPRFLLATEPQALMRVLAIVHRTLGTHG